MNIKVKICGIKNVEDAIFAQSQGAWAIGYIFVPESQRYIEPIDASKISEQINIEKIGVFANYNVEKIVEAAKVSKISKIQLHGDEPPEFCKQLKEMVDLPIIKAIRLKEQIDIDKIMGYKDFVELILLDTYSEKALGGTGEAFDWTLAQKAISYDIPVILAGGINVNNVKNAIESVKPFAIDLSSAVESSLAVKSHCKIKEFFDEIKNIEV